MSTAEREAWKSAVAVAIARARRGGGDAVSPRGAAERELFDLAESLGVGVTVFDAHQCLCFISRTARGYFAAVGPLPIGTPFQDILLRSRDNGAVTETPASNFDAAREMIEAGDVVELRLSDGTVLQGRTRPRPDGGWVEFWNDVTDVRRREAEARESEERYKALSEAASEGIVFDDDGIILDANRAAAEMFGYASADETKGRHLEEFLGSEHRGVVRHRVAQRCEDRAVYRAFHRDGREMWIEAENRFITRRGRLVSLTCFRDVTEHLRVEEILRAAKEAAERADAAKTDFVRMIGHEVRNPLADLVGMLRLMLDDELSTAQRARAETAIASGGATIEIIDDLLDIARVEAGAPTLDERPLDLTALLDETLEPLGPRAARKGLALAGAVASDTPDLLIGDARRIRRILLNLVGNAIKYTETGGVAVLIRPLPRSDLPESRVALSITVEDSGMGVTPEGMRRLFRPFGRSPCPNGPSPEGVGLGSTITGALAELMGGTVDMESEPGRGSRFTVVVVLTRSDEARGVVDERPLSGLRVFVADPLPITAAVRRELLTGAGANIVDTVGEADAVLLAGPAAGFPVHAGARVERATDADGAPLPRGRLLAALGCRARETPAEPSGAERAPVVHQGRILVVEADREVISAHPPVIDPAPIECLIADLGSESVALMLRECARENATRAGRLAAGATDLAAAIRDAHTLKSTAAAFGMRALEAVAREVEAAARAGDERRVRRLAPSLPDLARAAEERLRTDGRIA